MQISLEWQSRSVMAWRWEGMEKREGFQRAQGNSWGQQTHSLWAWTHKSEIKIWATIKSQILSHPDAPSLSSYQTILQMQLIACEVYLYKAIRIKTFLKDGLK